MSHQTSNIPLGYSDVPAGHLATVVTCLEMREKVDTKPHIFPEGVELVAFDITHLDDYRQLYRQIGEAWMWFSRIIMDDNTLSSILHDNAVEVYVLRSAGENIGILELDFRQAGECELAFFGLTTGTTGIGLGRALMNQAIALAWAKPIKRFWVHTCTLDHPAALNFYLRSGFKPYAFQVEVMPDPRLTGHLPITAAPHVPLIVAQ